MPAIALTRETTVDQILEAWPQAHEILHARSIDTCCGGAMTLEQIAQIRGGDPDALVADLSEALSPEPPVGDSAASPEPSVGDSAASPEPSVGDSAASPQAAATSPSPRSAIYSPFIKAALLCTLTFGAVFGAYNLLVIHLALGPMPVGHTWAHAGFQLWGFVLLFTMGVGLHVVPRFLGVPLARPRLGRSALPLGLTGMLLVAFSRFGASVPGTVPANVLGAVLELASVLAWAGALAATLRAARPAPAPWHRFLIAGTLHWILAALLLVAAAVAGLRAGDADVAADFNEAIYAAALFGGTLSWIQGMLVRTSPGFLGLAPPRGAVVRVAFWLGQLGALLGVAGGLRLATPAGATLVDLGLLATAACVVLFAIGLRPLSRGAEAPMPGDPHLRPLLTLAFAASLLFAVLAAGYALPDLAGHPSHRLVLDAARHAFALGFVTVTIFAMAGRILPRFAAVELRWPRLRWSGALLVAVGLVLREAQVLVALFATPTLLPVSAVSGVVAATGVVLAATSILGTLATARRARAAALSVPAATAPRGRSLPLTSGASS